MTAQELKNSILQLAIRGKLVEQRPEEGTAEELYRQIQPEKAKLLKAGKIKKEKPYSTSANYQELPFDIPPSWCFVRFGDLMISRDSERIPVSSSERTKRAKIYDYYGASGVIDKIDKYIFDEELLLIGEDGANLLSRSTPIAFLARGKYWVNNHAHVLAGCCGLYLKYICYYINAISLAPYVTGTAQPKMNQENMNAIWIALPPLEEQKRIVAKIEEIFPYIERFGELRSQLRSISEDLRKSILQQAIQGKLVEQRPEEGTAEELYRQIQSEKAKLLKSGKIFREKKIKCISDDEIPFDIPETWKWCRLGELTKIITKGSSPAWQGISYTDESNGILFVTSENVGKNTMLLSKRKYVDSRFNEMHPTSILQKGDILTNIVGASIGRTAVFNEETLTANINQAVCIIRLVDSSITDYLLIYLSSENAIRTMLNDTVDTARANLSLTSVSNLLIPLPPLTEQKRVVAKIEELLKLCDKLK